MSSNIDINLNEEDIKNSISDNDLTIECPFCNSEVTINLNQESVKCNNCNNDIDINNHLTDDIANAITDSLNN